jgi:glycosyltransferase involved in cell wall biosynthesis
VSGEQRSRKPRVVFVDHVAKLSGGEIALLRLLPMLRRRVDVHVILGEEGPLCEQLDRLDISSEVLPLDPRLRETRRSAVRPGGLDVRALTPLPAHVLRLGRRLRALSADLVHTNSLKSALYGGTAARMVGIPVLWHVRDRIADDYLPRPAVRLVRLAAVLLPTAIVTNSSATLATLPRHRATGAYNPVIPDAAEPQEARPPRDTDSPTIGIVGRLAPWKGQHVFLDAFAAAFGGTSVRARVIGSAMFGEDGYADELRSQVELLRIAPQVDFRGFREDVLHELAELDVLVHASITAEPFGQVILEGMAAGLPVVAAAAGGPMELITDGVDGLLTPPGDAPALTAALRRLLDDPELRERLGTAARERSRRFTPERTATQVIEVYRAILGPRPGLTAAGGRQARPPHR